MTCQTKERSRVRIGAGDAGSSKLEKHGVVTNKAGEWRIPPERGRRGGGSPGPCSQGGEGPVSVRASITCSLTLRTRK